MFSDERYAVNRVVQSKRQCEKTESSTTKKHPQHFQKEGTDTGQRN